MSTLTEPVTVAGRAALGALLAHPDRALLATDYDGVLAPIVDDPARAEAHPDAAHVLGRLAARLGSVAIVTGRPVEQVLRLGGLANAPGLDGLRVCGQYGVERWQAGAAEITAPPPPAGIAVARERVPQLLAELDLSDVYVEDKGRALGLHLRRTADPAAAMRRLQQPVAALAAELDLHVEPGKHVLELRTGGADKGDAVATLISEQDADPVLYAGDDLGDAAAYDAVDRHRAAGGQGLLVWSASSEWSDRSRALEERADLVLAGPDGVVGWFAALADRLADRSAAGPG